MTNVAVLVDTETASRGWKIDSKPVEILICGNLSHDNSIGLLSGQMKSLSFLAKWEGWHKC